ncbi:MAG TPA: four helix bundle suffix domain-containing protein [Candidatus Aquilonibacter sp.]|nr:four helix bundle suffix domain-containing protein [Candidatus Aquilonibacter sp.]
MVEQGWHGHEISNRLAQECIYQQRPGVDARRAELIAARPATADDVAAWVEAVHGQNGRSGRTNQSGRGEKQKSIQSTVSTRPTYPEIAANGALALIMVASSLLSRQVAAQAAAFEKEGGFTERLYRVRKRRCSNKFMWQPFLLFAGCIDTSP